MGRSTGVNLTKASIEAMPVKSKLYRIPDAQVRGLEIQMTPSGVRSWVLRFRIHSRQKTHTLGRWPELTVAMARKRAIELQADIAKGEDPAAQRKAERQAGSMTDLANQFRQEHLPMLKPGTRAEYERLLKRRILPSMGHLRAKDVSPSDVASLLSRIRMSTPKGVEANRTRAVLSKMFSLSSLWGYRPGLPNPAQGQARAPENKKDRHLSDKELVALGKAMRRLEPSAGERIDSLPSENLYALAALRLALLTGMRKSEIIGQRTKDKTTGQEVEIIPALRWDDVDLESARLRLKSHKTSKKQGTRIISLCTPAVDLLRNLPKLLGNPYVIQGAISGKSLVNLQSPWERVLAAVHQIQKLEKVPVRDQVDISDVTIHDLRRSFASLAARMGYPELIVAALLGHSAGSVTAGYARLGADPLREVVEDIGGRMAALLDGKVDLEAEAKAARGSGKFRRLVKGA